jgi:WD40 repeat protein
MLTLSTVNLSGLISRVQPLLQKDFVSILPNEISVRILSLTDAKTVGRASRVSKRWNELCCDNDVWKVFYVEKKSSFNQKKVLETLSQNSYPLFPLNAGLLPSLPLESVASPTTPESPLYTATHSVFPQMGGVDMVRNSYCFWKTSRPMQLATTSCPSLNVSGSLEINEINDEEVANCASKAADDIEDSMSRLRVSTVQPILTTDPNPAALWKYMYYQRYRLEENWRTGNYRQRELLGHEEGVYCIQFDDEKIVSGSRDDTIKVWDIQRQVCVRTYFGHRASVLCLQFDDQRIISGGSDTNIIVWQLVTGRILQTLKGHRESVLSLRFDDRYVVSCSKDKSIRVWRLDTGECIRTMCGHMAAVNAVQFLGDIVVSASGDRTIKMWSIETGECLNTLVGHTRGIACIQYDGKTIVSGSSDETIKVWCAETGECLQTLTGHTSLVRTVQFDDNWIVSGSYDETVKIWDRKTGQLLVNLNSGHKGKVFNLQFNDTQIASCGHVSFLALIFFPNSF